MRLGEEGREMIHKGALNKRDGEIQVYLFDHAILFTKSMKGKHVEQYKVYRRVSRPQIMPPRTYSMMVLPCSLSPSNSFTSRRLTTARRQGVLSGSLIPLSSAHHLAKNGTASRPLCLLLRSRARPRDNTGSIL